MDVVSLVVSLTAFVLALYFFKLATDQANRIEEASNAIKASAERNNALYDSFLKEVLGLLRDLSLPDAAATRQVKDLQREIATSDAEDDVDEQPLTADEERVERTSEGAPPSGRSDTMEDVLAHIQAQKDARVPKAVLDVTRELLNRLEQPERPLTVWDLLKRGMDAGYRSTDMSDAINLLIRRGEAFADPGSGNGFTGYDSFIATTPELAAAWQRRRIESIAARDGDKEPF